MDLGELNQPLERRFHGVLQAVVGDPAYTLWLAPLRLLGCGGGQLLLGASRPLPEWVGRRFQTALAQAGTRAAGEPVEVVWGSVGAPSLPQPVSVAPDPGLTFDTFSVGEANRFAHNAALTVAEAPAGSLNPLLICGPQGVGKTHLLHATAGAVASFYPALRTVLTTGERFATAFLSALRGGYIKRFKGELRSLDLLVVDDLDFIAGKEATAEEFLYTVEAILQRGGQVVLTGTVGEEAREPFSRTFLGRWRGGFTAPLEPPDPALRALILRRLAARQEGVEIEQEALALLAARLPANIRVLSTAFAQAVALASLQEQPLSVALAAVVLERFYGAARSGQRSPSLAQIKEVVGRRWGVGVEALEGRGQGRELRQARQVALYLGRRLTKASLQELGRAFGGRDHSTVLAAIRGVERGCQQDEGLRRAVVELLGELGEEKQESTAGPTTGVEGRSSGEHREGRTRSTAGVSQLLHE